jgi:methyl-accepting chemotaxis protein
MRVAMKLGLGFGVVALLLLVNVVVGITNMAKLNGNTRDIVEDRYVKAALVNQVAQNTLDTGRQLRNMVLADDPAAVEDARQTIEKLRSDNKEALAKLDKTVNTPKGRELLSAVEEARATVQTKYAPFYDLAKRDRKQATKFLLTDFASANTAFVNALNVMSEHEHDKMNGAAKDAEASYQSARLLMIVVGVIALAAAFFIAFLIIRSLNKQLGGEPALATEVANKIAKGDMSSEIVVAANDTSSLLSAMKRMSQAIHAMTVDAAMLAKAAVEGKLATRADADKHQGDFRKIVEGVNLTLDYLVGYIDNIPLPAMIINKNFEVLYMNKAGLGVGNTDLVQLSGKKCSNYFKTEDCNSEKCACHRAMTDQCISKSQTVARPTDKLNLDIDYVAVPIKDREGHVIGAFEVVMDQTAIKQAQRKSDKIAAYQQGEVGKLQNALTRIAAGDLKVKAEVAAADADTDATRTTFATIADATNQVVNSVSALVADANMLSKAAVEGKLATRADASKHQGDFRKIVQGVDDCLDAVIGPLNVAAKYVDQISKGENPPKITDNYNGDFNTIKNNLNACIEAINQQATAAQAIAAGDFSVKVNVRSEADAVAKSLIGITQVLVSLQTELQRLTVASKDGLLSERGKPEQFKGAYAEVVQGINQMLDAILLPIGEGNRILGLIRGGNLREKVEIVCKGDHEKMKQAVNGVHGWLTELVAYVTKIANGDMTATMAKASDQDQIHEWLMLMKNNINALVADANMLAKAAVEGKLATRADASKHQGDFRKIVQGVDDCLDAVIGPLNVAADYVDKISKGNIPAKITDNYNGDFNTIKNNLNQCIDAVNALVADAGLLSKAAVEGKLATRADASKHQGDFRKIVQGVDDCLDAVIGPLNVAAKYVDDISKGAIPAKITDNYNGDFNTLKNNLNQCIDAVNALVADANMLSQAAVEGRLATRADASKHQGDFRKIVQGVNDTLDAVIKPIQEAGAVLEKVAAGDLTVHVVGDYKGDHTQMKNHINTMNDRLRASMQQLAENAHSLASASEELNANSQQMSGNAEETSAQANVVSAGAEQVNKNLQTVSTGTEEMSSSIKEIAKNAHESAKVATSAVKIAEDTNQVVTKLGDSSIEIGQVIKVITSIAQQTNLLALNATIEAARAGEAGKGFAVVANEVKELAKQTAKATEDISRKIEAIQGDTKNAVGAIGQISGVIKQVNDISNTIATAVEEQNATTNEMARNVAEAAKGSEDIAKNIGGVAEAAQSTTHGANDALKAAQSLAQMSNELRELVQKFKIDSDGTGSVHAAKAPGSGTKAAAAHA